jgi:hypothetical protein
MDLAGSIQTSIFAYLLMAVVAMLAAVMVRGIVAILARTQTKKEAAPTSVSISVAPARDETAAHVAAVAAAVYAVLGAHRLVHIGEVPRGPGWTMTGRTAIHTSHLPRRTGR